MNSFSEYKAKIVIAYCLAGYGHYKTAKVIYDYLQQKCPQAKIQLVDVLAYSSIRFRKSYIDGYAFFVNHARWLWGWGFHLTCAHLTYPVFNKIHALINRIHIDGFEKFLVAENPDLVISTHFLPSEVTSCLKRRNRIHSRLFTVITDFGVHPFWITQPTDLYLVASDLTKKQLICHGVKAENISVSGIPVEQKFHQKIDPMALRAKLGIQGEKFTVLIATGSFGIGPIEKIIDLLRTKAQLLVVCAKNNNLFSRLSHKNYPGIKIFSFVNNIEELIGASDLVIMKPGGVSIAEILTMEAPPLFISPIPGHEEQNLRVLASYGIGVRIKRLNQLKGMVLEYINHPEKLDEQRKNIQALKKPFVERELCDVLC